MQEVMKPFLVAYRHEGSEWNIRIMASSHADAAVRLSKLALGRVEGELVATIPAAGGPLVALMAFLQNTWRLFSRS